MRILHIHNVANVGATLVEGLKQQGCEANLRCLNLAAPQGSTFTKLLVSPLRLREMWRVNREVKRGRYDIVHIHFAYLGWLGIIGHYPYFLHCHGSDIRRDLQDWRRRWFILKSIEKAQAVFFVTPDLADIILPIRPDAIFLPNPVNTETFCPSSEPNTGSLKILLASAFHKIKGIDIAMNGLIESVRQHPEIKVTVFAHGPEFGHYKNTPGIHSIHPVPHEHMAALYQSHDIVIGQFKIGSLGMVELESMACGCPVICHYTDTEWYPQPPPVIRAHAAEQIVKNITWLNENPIERQKTGRLGLNWIKTHHDYRQVANQLINVYSRNL